MVSHLIITQKFCRRWEVCRTYHWSKSYIPTLFQAFNHARRFGPVRTCQISPNPVWLVGGEGEPVHRARSVEGCDLAKPETVSPPSQTIDSDKFGDEAGDQTDGLIALCAHLNFPLRTLRTTPWYALCNNDLILDSLAFHTENNSTPNDVKLSGPHTGGTYPTLRFD